MRSHKGDRGMSTPTTHPTINKALSVNARPRVMAIQAPQPVQTLAISTTVSSLTIPHVCSISWKKVWP